MVCEVSTLPFFNSCLSHNSRCTALPSDLDGPSDHQTQELTEILLEEFGGTDGQVLWHNYGINENTIVSSHFRI